MNPETLLDLIQRNPNPAPWSEGDNIPWHEPGFSARMLKEHLTQDHDLASRRSEKIDLHVQFIHQEVLENQPGKLLDLGCGPGLYASSLARLGHEVTGIDYSPASIAHAQENAAAENLACTYLHADLREVAFGHGYAAAMLIFGEFNVFKPQDIRKILTKTHAALNPGGTLILEPHTFKAVQTMGQAAPSWYTSPAGLFEPQPHLVLEEYFWDDTQHSMTTRFFVVDANTGNVIRYAQSMQAYTDEGYRNLLAESGFTNICFYPALTGTPDPQQEWLIAITAVKA
jgi:cyclopropane fatty-acyl-phospholipid synthase-like methyltransferase